MSYFKPLRRKIGVVMLVLACVFAGTWVRGLSHHEVLTLPIGRSTYIDVYSDEGILDWNVWSTRDGEPFAYIGVRARCKTGLKNLSAALAMTIPSFSKPGTPFWSIVGPLTILSAWLLLSKPRAKIQLPTTATSENA